ncbi:uncharacterized protein LOC130982331 isoform X2 [Arachis stenosperma]|uniref:uncharacterized protein LOC130982331 isoform X2 n=1 Tax=Arachis stenosperma TaxID=217475 RepID=UPI0025ACBDF7|nr:uncharacterized protein LOC130982331 isoform X2 [Arachis stenosperma]
MNENPKLQHHRRRRRRRPRFSVIAIATATAIHLLAASANATMCFDNLFFRYLFRQLISSGRDVISQARKFDIEKTKLMCVNMLKLRKEFGSDIIVEAQIRATFYLKFENEKLDQEIRIRMIKMVAKGLATLEVFLKHSGSLFMYAGHEDILLLVYLYLGGCFARLGELRLLKNKLNLMIFLRVCCCIGL